MLTTNRDQKAKKTIFSYALLTRCLCVTESVYLLHDACRNGETATVQLLIENGHQVNQCNFDLVQPLHEACFSGHIDCVRLLLLAGANVSKVG